MAGRAYRPSGPYLARNAAYWRDISGQMPLTRDEEAALSARIGRGDIEARNRLVSANLKFVVRVANEYGRNGVAVEDLIGAGNLGLLLAAERFDASRGVRFITYAVYWIRRSIQKFLYDHSRTIRLPVNQIELQGHVARAACKLEQETAQWSTPESVSEEVGLAVDRVVDVLTHIGQTCSLDCTTASGGDVPLLDAIADEVAESPSRKVETALLRRRIRLALECLETREAEIIRLSYGLWDGEPLSLRKIGDRLSLSFERIRQIRSRALAALGSDLDPAWLNDL